MNRLGRCFGWMTGGALAVALAAAAPATAPAPTAPAVDPGKVTNDPAPEQFRVTFVTSKGPVVIEVTRALAPLGADRFYNLVKSHYFDGDRFFRVVPGFVVQFGLAANPKWDGPWEAATIKDDPVKSSNARGTVTFAMTSQKNSRCNQLFINLGNNQRLDAMGFAPIGKVVEGMHSVDELYSGYGERPDQDMIEHKGNEYLELLFPDLDFIKSAQLQ